MPFTFAFAFLHLLVLSHLIKASPLSSHRIRGASGVRLQARQDGLPVLDLPYQQVKANNYDAIRDIYVFKNIPFAAPPVGDLRWRAPAPPLPNDTIADGSYGPSCVQTGIGAPLGDAGALLGPQSEDCLYLDVYAPGAAVRGNATNLPVIHWIYGGAYVLGSKDMYAGKGLVSVTNNNAIYVASNYRVGAFGWLAGETMEQEGLPNAGLHDVHAALNWTKQYIGLVGGDAGNVAAWGESAGAGCLFHLLTAGGGTIDPLFKRLVLQSPAFDFSWDRRGTLENQTQKFISDAGCEGQGVSCLRQASPDALKAANDAGTVQPYSGRTAYQVAADGSFVRQLAALELASGNFWKGLESVILSHVEDEALIFTDTNITTPERFRAYLEYAFPTAGVPEAIEQQYSNYVSQTSRLHDVISGSRLVCNVRFAADALLEASGTRVWNMQYAVPPALHGTDLIPTFFLPDPPANPLNNTGILNQGYQSYLTSLSRAGDPNTFRRKLGLPATIEWPEVDNSGQCFGDVLNVGALGFSLIADEQNSQPICNFWQQVAAAVTELGGYAPPGAVVEQSLLPQARDASANYGST